MTGPIGDDAIWLVAVDDDPTGCQSVAGVPLLTAWDHDTLTAAARRRAPVTFILTNSRSMAEADAVRVNADVGAALASVADAEGVRLRLISRSDSTLRGHFPAEVDALTTGAGFNPDAIVLCPAFFEAGRFTADGIQWIHRNSELIAARDTEFANDTTFGYDELTLAEWAHARSADRDVIEIDLETLARSDTDAVAATLAGVHGHIVIVNATNYQHLATFDLAARQAERLGRRFLYRTGPSYVRVAAGTGAPSLARFGGAAGRAGLVVVGSHTDITNAQIAHATSRHQLANVELDAGAVLDPQQAPEHIADVVHSIAQLPASRSVLLRTSRTLITASGGRSPLEISRTIADALTATVRHVAAARELGFVIAKGGITSHELLSSAFEVRTAEVIGPALPGIIPVLEIDVGRRRIPYVIFPGNVGDEHALTDVLARFLGPQSSSSQRSAGGWRRSRWARASGSPGPLRRA